MNEHVARFARIVDEDRQIFEELWGITEPTQFVATVVRLASERGVVLAGGEVWEAFNVGRLAWLASQTS